MFGWLKVKRVAVETVLYEMTSSMIEGESGETLEAELGSFRVLTPVVQSGTWLFCLILYELTEVRQENFVTEYKVYITVVKKKKSTVEQSFDKYLGYTCNQ